MSFKDDIDKWIAKTEKNADKVFKEATSTLYKRIVEMTPVDSGRAKNGWSLEFKWDTATIINQVPYIIYLEYGHSKQAPHGMVRLNVQKWNKIIEQSARDIV